MNAEFQRISSRDKKAFLSDQCKEIEGNNRMGKTRDLFKKIRDTKGTFHTAKPMVTIQVVLRKKYRRQGSRPSQEKEMQKGKMVV